MERLWVHHCCEVMQLFSICLCIWDKSPPNYHLRYLHLTGALRLLTIFYFQMISNISRHSHPGFNWYGNLPSWGYGGRGCGSLCRISTSSRLQCILICCGIQHNIKNSVWQSFLWSSRGTWAQTMLAPLTHFLCLCLCAVLIVTRCFVRLSTPLFCIFLFSV